MDEVAPSFLCAFGLLSDVLAFFASAMEMTA
jgi:hypothetical protein